MSKKEIEQELQTDPFFDYLGKIIDYFKENKAAAQWSAIGIIGVILLSIVISNYRASSIRKDLIAYEQATTSALVQEYLDGHKSGAYYPHALYKKANYAFEDGKYTDALEAYKKITDDYPKNLLAAQAYIGIGYANIALGNYEDAAKAFSYFIEKYVGSPFISDARLNLTRCMMKLGKYEQALSIVTAFIEENPNSVLMPEAEKLLPEINRNL